MKSTGKTCLRCGEELITDSRHQTVMKYCSDKCRREAWKDRQVSALRAKIEELNTMVNQLAGHL